MAKKRGQKHSNHHVNKRLRFRVVLYFLISFVMIGIVLFDVWKGQVSLTLALLGIVVGGLIGIVASRMFHIRWDEQTSQIVSKFDTFGIIILLCYMAFSIDRQMILGIFVHGHSLAAFSLSVVAGTMLGRAIGTGRSINKILLAQGLHPKQK